MSDSNRSERRMLRVDARQEPNGYWRCIVHATIPGYPGRLEREANSFHTEREAIVWAMDQYDAVNDWAKKALKTGEQHHAS